MVEEPMTTKILFVHSAGPQTDSEGSTPFVKKLRGELGSAYEVVAPVMPLPDKPAYGRWKLALEKHLTAMAPKILIGHSLGGSILLKYLSEETYSDQAITLLILAAPFWGEDDWQLEEFVLREHFSQFLPEKLAIYFYQSRDDEVVPISHINAYAKAISKAKVRILNTGGHGFENGLPELVKDITALQP